MRGQGEKRGDDCVSAGKNAKGLAVAGGLVAGAWQECCRAEGKGGKERH